MSMFQNGAQSRCGKRQHSEAFNVVTGELYGYCVHCMGSVRVHNMQDRAAVRQYAYTYASFFLAICAVAVCLLPLMLWIAL